MKDAEDEMVEAILEAHLRDVVRAARASMYPGWGTVSVKGLNDGDGAVWPWLSTNCRQQLVETQLPKVAGVKSIAFRS